MYPYFTTLQKFFQKLPSSIFKTIIPINTNTHIPVKGEIIALDGTGFPMIMLINITQLYELKNEKAMLKTILPLILKQD